EWTLGIYASHRRGVGGRQDLGLRCRPPLEILIGFPQACGGSRVRPAGLYVRDCLGRLWCGHFWRLRLTCVYPELLLELQVRETAHRRRCHRGFRCVVEETSVVLHGLLEALLDLHFLHVRAYFTQLCKRARCRHWFRGTRGAAGDQQQRKCCWHSEAGCRR